MFSHLFLFTELRVATPGQDEQLARLRALRPK
eukprot:COSAG01_NODE_64385_length_276_cov_2.033898_1_plen_31_part_10